MVCAFIMLEYLLLCLTTHYSQAKIGLATYLRTYRWRQYSTTCSDALVEDVDPIILSGQVDTNRRPNWYLGSHVGFCVRNVTSCKMVCYFNLNELPCGRKEEGSNVCYCLRNLTGVLKVFLESASKRKMVNQYYCLFWGSPEIEQSNGIKISANIIGSLVHFLTCMLCPSVLSTARDSEEYKECQKSERNIDTSRNGVSGPVSVMKPGAQVKD
ncbi:uncharacterized protein LOC129922170 isoform X2 [Biomphalaria glabrata]|uniref:Uncharacterized protein LOC129922170 isoform X2 n=1 Tax=Biomphalaria glabrata TaxID=6526 RepID=A0A9W2YK08_BIOGL|nr:uncharacterized protein LOC129922170 isoform X2 [Biomphalaria glabrata]